nr:PREDICTED: E3 ubiquitin-protein ligase SPL2 isoform X2 [Musa acuminata subsp. malaccensis]
MSFRDHEMAAAVGRLVLAYDGAIAGLALAAFAAVSWVKYLAASAALVRIRRATSVPISGLRSLLSSDDSSDEDGVLVVVRGLVQPSSTVEALGVWPLSKFRDVLTPRGSGERAVAVLSTQTCLYNEWRGMFGWSSDLNALLMRSWKERRSSSLELAIFGSGYPVALLHEEKILPVGKEITAIGICRPRDGALEIKSCKNLPFFLSDMTKDELEAELNSNTRILLWSGILIGTLSFGILGYALVRNWRKWKEWRTRRREIQDLHDESLIESSMEAEDAPEGELCVICLSTRRRSAFIPCGHLVCCSRCALHVERDSSPKCPVCRQDVRSSIRIYDS